MVFSPNLPNLYTWEAAKFYKYHGWPDDKFVSFFLLVSVPFFPMNKFGYGKILQ